MNGGGSLKIDKVLFEAAAAIEDLQLRDEFLITTCGGDAARRMRIQEWLDARTAADAFFRSATLVREQAGAEVAAKLGGDAVDDSGRQADRLPGSRIGHYRVVEKIGEGGFGSVYVAEQDEPVRRRVALKILRLGLGSEKIIARFQMERQALALMDHPHIARVFDAGVSDDGRPFFVMELVHGVKITEHCDAHGLDLRQRLELFIQVCQAIQHAHQKGVIHRDIKPSNILVSGQDREAFPKVIDFGIARAVENRLLDETAFTAFDPLLGTPAYMSPEQAGGGQDLDTRADVYSLGVLLHELLTGRTPFDGERLTRTGMLEMLRILCEEEPPAPSAQLARLNHEELAVAAAARNSVPSQLASSVRGDLDGIVAKAMAKDRRYRYETVNGLARDIQRHLNDEPVSARPPGRLYLLGKLLRRHKVAFSAAAVVVLALVVASTVSTGFYFRERDASEEQSRQRRLAEAARANESRLLQQAEARESVSRAAMLLAEGKTEEADAVLLKTPLSTIEPSMEAAKVFGTLGDWNAIRQRWSQAADCYRLFLQASRRYDSKDAVKVEVMTLLSITPTWVESGNLDEYSRFRSETIGRYENLSGQVPASILLKTYLLTPVDEALLARLRPHVERLAASLPAPDFPGSLDAYQCAYSALSLALFDYRSGNFAGALEWSRKALAYPNSCEAREAAVHALTSLAAGALGKDGLGREELARARDYFAKPFVPDVFTPRGAGQGYWMDWAVARILLREAERAGSGAESPSR